MELWSPQIEVTAGGYIFTHGLQLELHSNAKTYYDWAKVKFITPMERRVKVEKQARCTIRLGYNGSLTTVFTGYSTNEFLTGMNADELIFKDGMLLLEQVTINNTFLQATPQEVIGYCAGQAGVTRLRLGAGGSPIPQLPIFNQSAARVIGSLGGRYGLPATFFFQDDTLYWNEKPDQANMYCFEQGKNIIRLELYNGCWRLETVSVPFVRHSQRIRVRHERISGDFPVLSTLVTTHHLGFIRTIICFEGA